MLIEYITAAGQEIKYDIGVSVVCMDDVNNIALMYAQAHPTLLPDSVYMHVSVMTDFAKMMGVQPAILSAVDLVGGRQFMVLHTGCGPLVVHPVPWGWQGPKLLVGIQADFDEYDIDKIFEKTVLKIAIVNENQKM